jgi:hypothetical protein
MAGQGDDALDLNDVTFDISGKDLWTKLRIFALADPNFATALLATAPAVAELTKLDKSLTPAQTATEQAKTARINALSSNTFGMGPLLRP